MNDGGGAHHIKVTGLRAIDASFALRDNDDGLILSKRIDKLNGTLPAHGKGQDGVRE
jgi:hypothetical protein